MFMILGKDHEMCLLYLHSTNEEELFLCRLTNILNFMIIGKRWKRHVRYVSVKFALDRDWRMEHYLTETEWFSFIRIPYVTYDENNIRLAILGQNLSSEIVEKWNDFSIYRSWYRFWQLGHEVVRSETTRRDRQRVTSHWPELIRFIFYRYHRVRSKRRHTYLM